MADNGNNIENLQFGVILDSAQFEKDLKRVANLATRFEKSVSKALDMTKTLETAQENAKALKQQEAAHKKIEKSLEKQAAAAQKAANAAERHANAAEKRAAAEEKRAQKAEQNAAEEEKRANAEEKSSKAATVHTAQLTTQSRLLKGLASYAAQYLSVFGAAAVVKSIVRITGEFEAQRVALRAILNDTNTADKIFNQLQTLAVKSPFTFRDLTSYAKQLSAFSFPADELYDVTKMLSDISAGLGVDMDRIVLAYGQVHSAEFLRGQEVRQFTEAGIPILQEIANQFSEIEQRSVSVGEVFDRISARQVPFEMVEEAFRRMTSEGGKFYNMQEVLAETVKGKVSNLQDAWEIMLSKIGDEHSGTIKGIINWLTDLFANYEKWIGELGAIIRYVGVLTAVLAANNIAIKSLNAVSVIRNAIEKLHNANLPWTTLLTARYTAALQIQTVATGAAAAAQTALTASIQASKIVTNAAIGILTLVGVAIYTAVKRGREARTEVDKITATINSAIGKLNTTLLDFDAGAKKVENALNNVLLKEGDTTEETEKFNKAVDELKKQFPNFIDDNIRLAGSVDELGKYWAKARQEMNQYYADQAQETIKSDLQQNREERTDNLSERFTKYITGKFSEDEQDLAKRYATLLWRYVLGTLDLDEIRPVLTEIWTYLDKDVRYANYGWKSLSEYIEADIKGVISKLEKFREEYNGINYDYISDLHLAEKLIEQHELHTQRKNFNDYVFSLTGAKRNYTVSTQLTEKEAVRELLPYAKLSAEMKRLVQEQWAAEDTDGIALGIEETIEDWAARMRKKLADEATSSETKNVIRQVFEQFGIPESTEITGWRKDVNDTIDGFGEIIRQALKKQGELTDGEIEEFVLSYRSAGNKEKVKSDSGLASLIEKWSKGLEDTEKAMLAFPTKYKTLSNDAYRNLWLDKLLYQSISRALYGDETSDFVVKAKEAGQTEEEYFRDRITQLKREYDTLKSLKSAYDDIKSLGFNDKDTNRILQYFFGRGIPAGGFDNAFENIAKGLESFNDFDSASQIRNYASGKDWDKYSQSVKNARQAQKSFNNALEDLQASVKRLNLSGFATDIDKILVDTEAKNNKLRTDWAQKERDFEASKDGWIKDYRLANAKATITEAEAAWKVYYDKQVAEAKKAIDATIEYNNTVAQRQIDKKANSLVNELLQENGIELTNWDEKTPEQIDKIKSQLEALKTDLPGLIPPEVQEDADKLGVSFETLLQTIIEILDKKIDITVTEQTKKDVDKLATTLKTIGSYLNKIGTSVSKFSGDWEGVGDALGSLGSSMSSFGDIYQKIGSGAMSKGAGSIAYLMLAAENIISAVSSAVDNMKALKEATEEWNLELLKSDYELANLQLDRLGYSQRNIFGVEDPYSKAFAASNQLREAQKHLQGMVSDIADIQVETQKEVQDWGETAKSVVQMGAAGAIIGNTIAPGIGALLGGIAGVIVGGTISAFTSKKMESEYKSLRDLIPGGQIYDPETLELTDEVLAKYDQLDDKSKAIVDNWKDIKETMQDALDTFNDNVEDVVGEIGDEISEMLVEAFNNGDVYDAIDDIHDYIGNAIQSLMSQIAFSKAFGPVFDELEADMRESFGLKADGTPMSDAEIAANEKVDYSWTDDLARANTKIESGIEQYKALMEYAKALSERIGYSWNAGEESSSSSLSSGIKSITEDTADLLASYLNAIRADVSYGKTQWERIAVAVEGQATNYYTLNDYLMRVQADTANISESNRAILERLDGFIRDFSMPSDLGDSLKVRVVN